MFANAYTDTRFEQLCVRTHYGAFHIERAGRGRNTGRAVLLVHGFGTNASLWRGTASRLAHAGCDVVAPDLLGFGASEWPRSASYTLAFHADALAAMLLSMGISDATVVGQDVGSLVGLMMASRFPDIVRELVLINPPDHRALPPEPVHMLLRTASRFPAGISDNALAATALVAALLARGTADPGQLSSDTVRRYLAPWLAAGGAEQLCRLANVLANETLRADVTAAVTAQTMIVRGERDRSVPGDVARTLAGTLQNAQLQTFLHHGRLLGEEAPHALAAALLQFMQRSVKSEATEPPVHA